MRQNKNMRKQPLDFNNIEMFGVRLTDLVQKRGM